jgi:hypothetical protein
MRWAFSFGINASCRGTPGFVLDTRPLTEVSAEGAPCPSSAPPAPVAHSASFTGMGSLRKAVQKNTLLCWRWEGGGGVGARTV